MLSRYPAQDVRVGTASAVVQRSCGSAAERRATRRVGTDKNKPYRSGNKNRTVVLKVTRCFVQGGSAFASTSRVVALLDRMVRGSTPHIPVYAQRPPPLPPSPQGRLTPRMCINFVYMCNHFICNNMHYHASTRVGRTRFLHIARLALICMQPVWRGLASLPYRVAIQR